MPLFRWSWLSLDLFWCLSAVPLDHGTKHRDTTHFSHFPPQWLPGGRVCSVLSHLLVGDAKSSSSFSSPKANRILSTCSTLSLSLLREMSQPVLTSCLIYHSPLSSNKSPTLFCSQCPRLTGPCLMFCRTVRHTLSSGHSFKKTIMFPFFSFPLRQKLLSFIDLCLLYCRSPLEVQHVAQIFFKVSVASMHLKNNGLHLCSKRWDRSYYFRQSPENVRMLDIWFFFSFPQENTEAEIFFPMRWHCARGKRVSWGGDMNFLLTSSVASFTFTWVKKPLNLKKDTGPGIIDWCPLWKEGRSVAYYSATLLLLSLLWKLHLDWENIDKIM